MKEWMNKVPNQCVVNYKQKRLSTVGHGQQPKQNGAWVLAVCWPSRYQWTEEKEREAKQKNGDSIYSNTKPYKSLSLSFPAQ